MENEILLVILSVLVIPAIVQAGKWAAVKLGWTWATGKGFLSAVTFVLAVGVAVYDLVANGGVGALPVDPMEAAVFITAKASAVFGAATVAYNVLLSKVADRLTSAGD